MVKSTLAFTNHLIDQVVNSLRSSRIAAEARETVVQAKLESIQLYLELSLAPERRLALLQGQIRGENEIADEFSDADNWTPAKLTSKVEELIGEADAARTILKELKIKPKAYYRIANAFLSGEFAKSFPGIIRNKLSPGEKAQRLVQYLKKQKIKHHKALGKATKFFGLALVGLTITTVVFETLADEDRWAQHFSKAVFAAGAGAALGAIVTTSAVTSVITATLVAAGSTAEVPPVAAAIVAAAIVIIGSIAVAALFDSLIDLIFGISDISPSMRLSMSTQMYSSMSSSMSSSMVASMVPTPK